MTRDELLRLFDAGDTHGLLLGVLGLHATKAHPGWRCDAGMTTEELKNTVRRYADEHYPSGWTGGASVMICTGPGEDDYDLIKITPRPESPPTACSPSVSSPAR